MLGRDWTINSNRLNWVYENKSKYFNNASAHSQLVFDAITDRKILSVARKYIGSQIRLKCHRVYETKPGYHGHPWHTDNKIGDTKDNSRGFVAIIYLNDTMDGGTELVPGSHKDSASYTNSVWTDEELQNKYDISKTLKFTGKAGDMIVSDHRVIHRGSYWSSPDHNSRRQSLWFQIVDEGTTACEPLLLNPAFLTLNALDTELASYLGFGQHFHDVLHPVTSLGSMPSPELFGLARNSVGTIVKRWIPRSVVRMIRGRGRSTGLDHR